MDKNSFKAKLNRMGVPIYPGDKLLKEDIISLPFQSSGLKVVGLKPIKTEKHPDYCLYRVHLSIQNGDAARIASAFNQNKECVEKKLSCYCRQKTGGLLNPVKIELQSHNDENAWLNIMFHYNPKALFQDCDFKPFYYHLMERS